MQKILCFGTFDFIHKGHTDFFKDCKKQGDYLIVIVISDESVYENKQKYSINNQKIRAKNLRKLDIINKVVEVKEKLDKNLKLIEKLNPNIIVFGYDQKSKIIKIIKNYFKNKNVKYYKSKKFAEGIHSSYLRKKALAK